MISACIHFKSWNNGNSYLLQKAAVMTKYKNVYRTLSNSQAGYIREMQSIVYNCRIKNPMLKHQGCKLKHFKAGNCKN